MPQPAVLPVKGAAVGLHLLLGAGTVPPFLCLEGPSLSAAPGCFPAKCLLLDRLDDEGAGLEGAAWVGAVHPKSGQPETPDAGGGSRIPPSCEG